MKKLGYLLIMLSFLVGSLVAVQDTLALNWTIFIPILVAGFIGVVMAQSGHRAETQAAHRVADDISTLHKSLENVVHNVERLDGEKDKIHTYDMRHKIDELLLEDLDNFAEVREAIGHKYGLQEYADVMSHFAAGERYINRVWSASADGYIDEVNQYVGRSATEFKEAFSLLKKLEASRP